MTFALPRLAAAVLLLLPAVVVGTAGPAAAAQDDLVSETFAESTVKDKNWRTGGNDRFKACLTASTATGQTPVPGCASPQYGLPAGGDPSGDGALRLTNPAAGRRGSRSTTRRGRSPPGSRSSSTTGRTGAAPTWTSPQATGSPSSSSTARRT